ncbi:unnamed protein product [Paramecium octaurelia]|uniref:Uncharacterized protein n=1 Tax=Paramecium octaurelia TaxID=43137 RepID=A0A8S1VC46_PAROT|nr:unnamed protein product [Paramecium octaurelia]
MTNRECDLKTCLMGQYWHRIQQLKKGFATLCVQKDKFSSQEQSNNYRGSRKLISSGIHPFRILQSWNGQKIYIQKSLIKLNQNKMC